MGCGPRYLVFGGTGRAPPDRRADAPPPSPTGRDSGTSYSGVPADRYRAGFMAGVQAPTTGAQARADWLSTRGDGLTLERGAFARGRRAGLRAFMDAASTADLEAQVYAS